jgi:hypothetical protein
MFVTNAAMVNSVAMSTKAGWPLGAKSGYKLRLELQQRALRNAAMVA